MGDLQKELTLLKSDETLIISIRTIGCSRAIELLRSRPAPDGRMIAHAAYVTMDAIEFSLDDPIAQAMGSQRRDMENGLYMKRSGDPQ